MSYNLYNSILCRLCAEPDSNGASLEVTDPEGRPLRDLINKHLPLKVNEDDKFPRTVCQDCHLQVQNLVTFFALLIKGQTLLNRLIKQAPPPLQQNALKGPLYDTEHPVRAELVAGFDFEVHHVTNDGVPKKKRGRPRKDAAKPEDSTPPNSTSASESFVMTPVKDVEIQNLLEPTENESPPDGKRRRKTPARFMEAIQGKELENVFRENGVLEDRLSDIEESGLQGDLDTIGQVLDSRGEKIGVMESIIDVVVENSRKKFQYRCGTCQAPFTQEAKFVEHVATHALDAPNCSDCGMTFSSSHNLLAHLEATGHFVQIPVNFQRLPSPSEKAMPAVDPFNQYECSICSARFRYAASLKNHLASEHEDAVGGFECDVCNKRLKHMSSLQYHKMTEHSGTGMQYACLKCNQTFRHRRLLQKHQLVHASNGDGSTWTCPECGKVFKSKCNMTLHQQFHKNGKRHVCATCNLTYASKSSLMAHMRTHTGEKHFECNFCKKSFIQKGNLKEHLRTHTGEKPFKCDLCEKSFTTYSQRRLHIKRHLDDREFRCESCGKTFLYRESLTVHMRRHRGEKPYECERCHKTFAERSSAIKHLRIHTGERPFACHVCGKLFSDNSNLAKHKKTHKTSEVSDILVSDLLTSDVSDLDKQFWVVKQDSQDGKDGDAQQVIYITYNDPDDPDSKVSEALLVGRDDVLEPDNDPLGSKIVDVTPNVQPVAAADTLTVPLTPAADPSVVSAGMADQLAETLQDNQQIVMDEQGHPLRFTTADGSLVHVTTIDGESFQLTTTDGTSVPVILKFTSDGQTLPPTARVDDIPSMVGDVSDDALTSAVVDSLELVSPADVRLLSEATLDLLT